MATMTTGTLPYLVDEVVTSTIAEQGFTGESMLGLLYAFPPASGRRERTATFGGLQEFQVKNETVESAEDSINQQFEKTFVHTVYAKHVTISQELMEDVPTMGFGDVIDMATAFGAAFNQTIESLACGPFKDAVAGATYLCEDGLPLASSAHVNGAGGNSQDNSLTNALDMDGIKATRTAMRKFTDYEGVKKANVRPDGLIVPTDLEENGWEIVRSLGRPDVLNNASNMYNGMFDLIVMDQLTDTNDWAMIDQKLMRDRRNLRWYWRRTFSMFGDGNLFQGKRRIGANFRSSHGVVDWRWICWNVQ